jgi:hypothetical protein
VFNFTSPSSPCHLILKCNKNQKPKHNFPLNCQLIHVSQFIFIALLRFIGCFHADPIVNIGSLLLPLSTIFKYLSCTPAPELDSIERLYIFPRIRSLSPYHKLSSQMFQRLSKIFCLSCYTVHISKTDQIIRKIHLSCFWLFWHWERENH